MALTVSWPPGAGRRRDSSRSISRDAIAVAVGERVHEADLVRAAPAPALGVRAVARPRGRRARSTAPSTASSSQSRPPISSGSPSSHSSIRRAWKRHGDGVHRREAELRLRSPALGVVRVADRRLRDEHGEVVREEVVDRRRRRSRSSRRWSQLLSRSIARTSRWCGGRRRASRCAVSSPGIEKHVELDAREVVERVVLALGQQLLDPLRAPAVEVLAGDVVRVVGRGDPVVGGDEHAARRVDERRQLVVGDVAVPLVLAGPARAWAGPGSCRGGRGSLPTSL